MITQIDENCWRVLGNHLDRYDLQRLADEISLILIAIEHEGEHGCGDWMRKKED